MYYFFYLLPVFLYFLFRGDKNSERARRRFVFIMTIILSLCSSLRHEYMGNDTSDYLRDYENVENQSWSTVVSESESIIISVGDEDGRDPGYAIVTKVCSYFMNFRVFMFLVALLITSAIGHLIYKYIKHLSGFIIGYAFYISLYYHYLPNSALRQTIAVGCLLWAYIIWYEKSKHLPAALLYFIGLTCHQSALLGLVPFFLMLLPRKSIFRRVTIVGFIIMVVAGQAFSYFFANLLGSETYMAYAMSSAYNKMERPIGFVIQMALFFGLSLFANVEVERQSRLEQLIYICFYLGIMTAPIILVSPSQIRGNAYYAIMGTIFIPNIIYYAKAKYRTLLFIILLALTLGRPVVQGVPSFKFMWDTMEYQGVH